VRRLNGTEPQGATPPLRYTREALLRSHEGLAAHVVAGRRLHGGFDPAGRYVPPRIAVRGPAVAAWSAALRRRGGDLLPADASLLAGIRMPNERQQKRLLLAGLGQPFWNQLTVTGKIEARGRVLRDLPLPDFQDAVWDDVSTWAVGHLGRGMLEAHGLDEGGEPERGVGGHDVMWFAVRDLAFGPEAFPDVEPPERIGRDDDPEPRVPRIPRGVERAISFLLNLLLIEFRAELAFSFAETLLRDPELFRDRRDEALEAAAVVGRIRADEAIHVDSLRLYLGELRAATFRTRDGGRLPGAEVVDPLWRVLAYWATVEQPRQVADQQRALYRARILAHPDGERLWEQFERLADPAEGAAAGAPPPARPC
jgi:hypothetical protein